MNENQSSARLPTQAASTFALAFTTNEFLLTVGQARSSVQNSPDGTSVVVDTDWIVTLAIPAPAAAFLRDLLIGSLANYEKQFGPIPKDPNQRFTLSEPKPTK